MSFCYGSENNCIRRASYVVQRWSAMSLTLWLFLRWVVDKMVHQKLFFDGCGTWCGTSWKWISLSHWIWTTSIKLWQFRQSFCSCGRRQSEDGADRRLPQERAPRRSELSSWHRRELLDETSPEARRHLSFMWSNDICIKLVGISFPLLAIRNVWKNPIFGPYFNC